MAAYGCGFAPLTLGVDCLREPSIEIGKRFQIAPRMPRGSASAGFSSFAEIIDAALEGFGSFAEAGMDGLELQDDVVT